METLQIHKKKNHAIIEIDNGKVNAINLPLLQDLNQAFAQLQADDTVKGVILAGRPNCFSAGLDIVSLAMGGVELAVPFWRAYFQLCQKMIRFSKPLVAAITGYAPAGATILALMTDYKIMARGQKHVFGMHEFKMNLQIPELLCRIYAYYSGEKNAWLAVQQAKLFHADDAVEAGLVNEAAEVEEVLPKAEAYLQKLMYVTPRVYADSKRYLTHQLWQIVDLSEARMEEMIEEHIEASNTPEAQMMVKMFVEQLKNK
ncbi:MAG: enoyl-CoA hydratase/isomerase family protein [Saprospiraceae bacterium]|nr:enoyl-CoA hydratase/isomerase family protein [Saprospiraceae bacterium]